MMRSGVKLRALLNAPECLITPGVYDGLSARLAEKAGFAAIAISGFGVEASLLGRPDIGLLTLSELTDTARRIANGVTIPVICDCETGFGGVHNIARLVHEMEATGIAAIQLEDQDNPKRCPAMSGRSVVSIDEQLVRLGAALAARCDDDFLIIARSDADCLGFDALIERCNRYLAAGADMAMPICFVVDGRSITEFDADGQMEVYARLAKAIDGPVKGVLIPEGYTAADMAAIGYATVGLTGGPIEAAASALFDAYQMMHDTGSEEAYRKSQSPSISAPGGIAQALGIADFLAFEKPFAADRD